MIIKFNMKKYFFFDNNFYQTDPSGNFNTDNIIQFKDKKEKEIKEFLDKHTCYTRETIVTKLGNSCKLPLPVQWDKKHVIYIVGKLD